MPLSHESTKSMWCWTWDLEWSALTSGRGTLSCTTQPDAGAIKALVDPYSVESDSSSVNLGERAHMHI